MANESSRPGAVATGATVIMVLGLGWFLLSHFVMRTATVDAFGEALGVMLGLLVLVSIVGAFSSSKDDGGHHR